MKFLTIKNSKAKVDETNTAFHGQRHLAPKRDELPPPSADEIDVLGKEFDFSTMNERVALFAKHYILNGSNATKAVIDSGLYKGKSETGQRVFGSKMLRRLRSHPEFWDMLGLGYQDLKEVVDRLKIEDPKSAAAIIMKVNKEDTEQVQHSGSIKIAFEKDLDSSE
jgi:hypothetical protein